MRLKHLKKFENMGFEIMLLDVLNSCEKHLKISLTDQEAEQIMGELDLDEVESCALAYDDMDEQTDAAHKEIAEQIKKRDYLLVNVRKRLAHEKFGM